MAHGRSHADGPALVHVTLANERPEVLDIPTDRTVRRSLAMGDGIPDLPDSAVVLTLELPAIAPAGHGAVVRGSLIALELPGLPPVAEDKNDTILAYSANPSSDFLMFAREGSVAPESAD